jgi:pyruvate dehydrogenase E2 component (dihydrolipoamide acetyltransferase)
VVGNSTRASGHWKNGTATRRAGASAVSSFFRRCERWRASSTYLNLVHASGPDGTITRADVERAAKSLTEAGPAEALRGMRRAMAQRMAAAHAEVVPASVTEEADIGDWTSGQDATIRLVRAIATACKAEPSLNTWYNAGAGERRLVKRIDIGIAVDTEGGLIVPVLRNVGERDARDLRAGLDRMRADAEARSIPPDELRGATITLSNFGMIGGRFANLIVVPPQVAIVGAGRIGQRVMAHQGQPAVRRVMPLSLTFDHRVVTGGEAARFLVALKSDLEQARAQSDVGPTVKTLQLEQSGRLLTFRNSHNTWTAA